MALSCKRTRWLDGVRVQWRTTWTTGMSSKMMGHASKLHVYMSRKSGKDLKR